MLMMESMGGDEELVLASNTLQELVLAFNTLQELVLAFNTLQAYFLILFLSSDAALKLMVRPDMKPNQNKTRLYNLV
jgi:hypothetical protein